MFRRVRTAIVFFLLLMACVAAPSLADDPPSGPPAMLPPAAEEIESQHLPGPADITAGIERVEEEEAERDEWLESPEAVHQREASLTAFAGVSAAAAEALLGDTFSAEMESLNADPARYLSDAQLLAPSEDPTAGTVKADGDSAVLDAAIPLRTENEEGELQKVDLTLEEGGGGYETTNAIVDVTIPGSAADSIEVGEGDGIGISQTGAAPEHVARRFGDENIFYPNVLPDTDMLVAPIAGGVEIFNQLRSESSPETFRFEIDVPASAVLRTGNWGVELVADGKVIATIPQATAVDAQGTNVPVEMTVDGHSVVLRVDHRGGDYAMPILLDPILENNQDWIYGQNHNALDLGVWGFNKNVVGMYGSTYCIYHCFGQPSNVRGLFASAQSGSYFANQFAQWSYAAPTAASFITSVTLSPYVRFDHGCNAATTAHKQPHDYFGIWGTGGWNYLSINSANQPGHSYTLPQDGRSAIFGLGSGGSNFSIPCWRDLYAGGAHVWLDDSNYPYFDWFSPQAKGAPEGWVSDETPFTITSQVSDAGLGIKNVRLHHTDGPTITDIPEQHECAGTRRSPCHTTHTASFDAIHGGYFFQGERDAWLTATDATGKSITSNYHWTMRVDNEPPEIFLKGEFAEETDEVGEDERPAGEGDQLSLPVYNLVIEAEDYPPGAQAKGNRSGVKDIEIFLDEVEQEVPWASHPCDISGRCPPRMSKTYPVPLSSLTTSGEHVLKVVAVDQVGKRMKREIEFEYFPATGMKDEYVMHYFPLPDGQGDETEEEHPERPELAVNVMNGNLVYRETDIDIEGAAALDLEVERFYNSMLPDNENTEWGEGWTLAQTPELDPIKTSGSPVPNEAEVLDSSGALEDGVGLPTEVGAEKFDPALQATLTKKASGGYELTDETGESPGSISFDATGQAEALVSGGYAKVDYVYESGELAEIEVSDPATFSADPAELEIPEPHLITEPTHAGSFGSMGAGDGQLRAPGGIAVDPQGNLWVVDKTNNRIQKFDPTGKFLAKFGSTGSGDGQFNRPTAIAVAANGDLLVTDAGNSRVQRFSSTGIFIAKFGSKGTGNGQFGAPGPEGIAIDAAGNIWVADTYGGRIQKFSSAGAFLQSVGSKGSAPGQFGEPTGIDIDPSGNVWVADWQNHRVSIFNAAGIFVSSFGSMGTGDGQFKNPGAIEVDNLGSVWVGDLSNQRVQQFDLSGQFKAKFGSAGSGAGQFSFSNPMDIAADSKGNLWVSDVNNNRVQQWLVPVERPAYVRSFGTAGSGEGQLATPADVAVGIEHNLWVVDRSNNRIQRFDKSGKYLDKFGTFGSGDGQFNRPTAIAVDRDGNLLVTDSGNNRVQKFSPEGQFLSKFGSGGTGEGQFSNPEGIAADFEGNVWVSDSGNGRIQRFGEEGEFVGTVSSKGSGLGELGKPVGIDVDPEGRLWIGDIQNHRVAIFEADGDFVGQFGAQGTGPGQFNRPRAIEIDAHDNVWVVDQSNGRIQRFDLDGQFVGQFGSPGNGDGQFSFSSLGPPVGIAGDSNGRIWVTDAYNNRIQQWMLGHYAAEASEPLNLSDGDPKVEVESADDLVASVSGNAAGTHIYEHEGDFLVSYDGPDGETLYEKNSAGLLSKVTLPNGTWGSIAYYADRRVKSVTVAPSGSGPKATHFYYQDGPPRRSVVTPPDKPQLTYDIASDGSVLKWWHKPQKPEFLAMDGSLWVNKETEVPAGDLVLRVSAASPHGLASIEVIANGNQLVSEKRCTQDPETIEIECPRMEDLWVTDTASLAPGVLNLEVIVTDRWGDSVSERWWVKIPHTPPPVPGYPQPPKFSEILKFREDFGLEVVFPVANEQEQAERIFGLINAWHSPETPDGGVARATADSWGVPLRPVDAAEMEYRESYIAHAAAAIPQWVSDNGAGGDYAGYYVSHRQGGLIYVGFTASQQARIAALKDSGILPADRVRAFPFSPAHPLNSLKLLENAVLHTNLPGITKVQINVEKNKLDVGATDVAQVQSSLAGAFGPNAPIDVNHKPRDRQLNSSNWGRPTGPVKAAEKITSDAAGALDCSAGFGAWDQGGEKPDGSNLYRHFLLSAGHCFPLNAQVYQWDYPLAPGGEYWRKDVGYVTRYAFEANPSEHATDALAIKLNEPALVPRLIRWSHERDIRIAGATTPKEGMVVCIAGAVRGRSKCGETDWPPETERWEPVRNNGNPFLTTVPIDINSKPGDSGGPIWERRTGDAIGTLTGGNLEWQINESWITPLKELPGYPTAPGSLRALGVGGEPLHVVSWK